MGYSLGIRLQTGVDKGKGLIVMMQGRVQALIRDGAPAADVLRFETLRLGDVAHRAALMHAEKVQEECSIKHSIFEKLSELVTPDAKFSSDQFTVVENYTVGGDP